MEDKLRCLMDIDIPEESECAWCCIYCDKKETCEYCCAFVQDEMTEKEIIKKCNMWG